MKVVDMLELSDNIVSMIREHLLHGWNERRGPHLCVHF